MAQSNVRGVLQLNRCALLWIILVAFVARAIVLAVFEGEIHDGITRVSIALAWLSSDTEIFGRTVWPEGNYLLPAAILSIWNDTYWAPRFLYLLVGVSNVVLAYFVALRLADRPAAVAAGWIVALMPFHVMTSVNGAMSETPYISLLLAAVLALSWYERSGTALSAATMGLLLAGASMFRLDGVIWGLPLALGLAHAIWRRNTPLTTGATHLAIFGVCGLLYVGGLILQWQSLYSENPFTMIDAAKLNTHQFFVNGEHPRWPHWFYQTYAIAFWPASLFVISTPGVAAIALFGLVQTQPKISSTHVTLIAGIGIVSCWLAFAAFSHDILTQWRYSLVLCVVLSLFFMPGLRNVQRRAASFTTPRVAAGVVLIALVMQAIITVASFKDFGAVSRQLLVLSPLRPSQYAGRDAVAWLNSQPSGRILVTPHVLEYPYAAKRFRSLGTDRVTIQGYYASTNLVHSYQSLLKETRQKMGTARYLVTSKGLREVGLRDGTFREIVQPQCEPPPSVRCTWEGFRLDRRATFGSLQIWEVLEGAKGFD